MADQNINIAEFPQTAMRVIMSPAAFFRDMPKSGGYVEPLAFMVAMGVISGLLQAVFSFLGLQFKASIGMALSSIVIFPIMIAIMGFIVAAIMFAIWKLMGSEESYETSYRCVAYVSALSPIMTVLNLIPYLGSVVSLVFACYFYVIASVETHGIPARKAWMVFGIIAAVLAVMSLSGQFAAKKALREAERMQKEAEVMQQKYLEQAEALRKQAEEAARAAQQQQGSQPGEQPTMTPEQAKEVQKAMEEMRKAMEKQKRD
ncbi:MAG: YIP1 family protein [Syntrophaceae bacterium]|nr:YIP1 family protein [Syntrophaceae bacterium]